MCAGRLDEQALKASLLISPCESAAEEISLFPTGVYASITFYQILCVCMQ